MSERQSGRGASALAIRPRGAVDATVRVPGSKSVSNRALVVAALADGESRLHGMLDSDDTRVMADALAALGAGIERHGDDWTVTGTGGALRTPQAPLDVHASGTAARFLTAVAALAPEGARVDGTARLRERPLVELAAALEQLGATVELGPQGGAPIRCAGGGLAGGAATLDARRSSQFVSALLLVAPFARRDVVLALAEGALPSAPYVMLTRDVMHDFGVEVSGPDHGPFRIAAGGRYQAREYAIEPDASTAAYFFCAAAISDGRVRVPGFAPGSHQADLALLGVLEQMGCAVKRDADAIEVRGTGRLRGVDADMGNMPDAVLALAVTALFADGPTTLRNVANLRIKESDRLAALESELQRLGGQAAAGDDQLVIEPAPLHGAEIETWDDHRVAMAFALAGLRVPGVVIRDPDCVQKSWPGYFDRLETL